MNNIYTNETVQEVWEKAVVIPSHDKDQARHDACGNLIYRDAYRITDSDYGWVISATGDDVVLQKPMHWRNAQIAKDPMIIGNCDC